MKISQINKILKSQSKTESRKMAELAALGVSEQEAILLFKKNTLRLICCGANSWWEDGFLNRWDFNKYSYEEARKLSLALQK